MEGVAVGHGKETRYLTTTGPHGEEVRVPVATVRGARDGPTVLMVAGVHACEYAGIDALRRLFKMVGAEELAGTLVTVPCLNLPGFFGLTPHVNPIDGVNAGRVFPGNPTGSHTERMVNLVWEPLARRADYVVDLHGGDLEEELADYSLIGLTGNETVDREAEALARALDMPIFVRTPAPADLPRANTGLRTLAGSYGIPSVLTEAGSHGVLDETEVARLAVALLNGLRHLRMVPGAPTMQHTPLVLNRFAGVYAPAEGFWTPAVRKGDEVRRGQLLGEIRGIFDEPLARVVAEEDAIVLVVATSPPRRVGDILFGLGMFT